MNNKLFLLILASAISLAGCAKKQTEEINTKSMAQIYAEEGIPVNTMIIRPEIFRSYISYNATVSGIAESTAYSKVSDSVEEILYSVGDYVKKDTVIVKFPKNNISANYYQSKSAYENAEAIYKRMQELYKAKGISKQDFDNAKAQYEVQLANWNNVNEMLNVSAPISGTITRLDVRETENINPGKSLFTIADMDKLKARVWIMEKDIEKIKSGNTAEAVWEGKTIAGKIVQLDMSLNPDKKAFGAVMEFDNSKNEIRGGVMVKINIITYEKKDAIVLDRKNIIFQKDGAYIFTIKNNYAVKKRIHTGEHYNNKVEITGGLETGEIIITEGNKNISNGSLIKIISEK